MKHQTPDSVKFKKLQRRLGLRQWQAIGLLEAIWIFTQKNAPRGDIGKHDNEIIAIDIGWDGDADEMVNALAEEGWIDRCPVNRLVVHDWPAHAPRYIHAVVARKGGFAQVESDVGDVQHNVSDCSSQLQSATTVSDVQRLVVDEEQNVSDCSALQPNLTKPNLTEPNETKSSRRRRKKNSEVSMPDGVAQSVVDSWNALGEPFKPVAGMTDARSASLRERLSEPLWRDRWQEALAKVKASSFCRGANDRQWIADIEFFLRPGTLVKILEGKYDDREKPRTSRVPTAEDNARWNPYDGGGLVDPKTGRNL